MILVALYKHFNLLKILVIKREISTFKKYFKFLIPPRGMNFWLSIFRVIFPYKIRGKNTIFDFQIYMFFIPHIFASFPLDNFDFSTFLILKIKNFWKFRKFPILTKIYFSSVLTFSLLQHNYLLLNYLLLNYRTYCLSV